MNEWDWSRPVVDHLDVHVSDFARSVLFYETVLTPLGIPKLYEREGSACFTHVNVVASTPPTCSIRTGTTWKRSIATSATPGTPARDCAR